MYKHRLAYVVKGVCVLRYDNESGKGDHRHFKNKGADRRAWERLQALCGAGPVTVCEAARRVGRDVKAVHTDLTALLSAGVLIRTEAGQVEFPYEAVKVAFLLQAA